MAGYSVTYTVVDNATKQIDAINRRIAQTRAPLDRMSRQISRFVDVSGLRKVATGFEWIGKAAGTVLRSLTAIVPVMGAITGAASIAGMVKLVSVYANWSRELVAAADNIGTTTQKLQQFEDATRLAGGNAATMRDSLKGLHDNLADFNRGGATAAMTGQWANKLGINLRDANGHIRTAADLLPDLIRKIAAMPDPADRAAAANALLGQSGDKLVETFRQSSKSFGDWFNDVQRYKDLTDEQKRSLQLFSEAQGRVGVAFDRLGQQISAMVARDLGPLLAKFATFVEQNTPAILAAVDRLSQRFAAWLNDPETGKAFVAGIKSVADSLMWVVNNLDTIKDAVEVIAGLFALKWAIGIVQAIGAVTNAIGATSAVAGAAAGTGLMGALAGVAAIAGLLALGSAYETPETRAATEKRNKAARGPAVPNMPTSDYWIDAQGRKHDATTGAIIGGAPVRPPGAIQKQSSTGGYLPGGATPTAFHPGGVAAAGLAEGSEFWDSMARAVTTGFEDAWDHITGTGAMGAGGGAGGGGYTQAAFRVPIGPGGGGAGGPGFSLGSALGGAGLERAASIRDKLVKDLSLSKAGAAGLVGNLLQESPGISGIQERNPIGGGRGGIGWAQWTGSRRDDFEAYQKAHPGQSFDQHNYGFLTSELQKPEYAGVLAQLRRGDISPGEAADVVERGYEKPSPGSSGRREANSGQAFRAEAPPVTMPSPAPVNGAVDVSITHKNPPPNSAVTATGTGSVNVAPPRVEHQAMESI